MLRSSVAANVTLQGFYGYGSRDKITCGQCLHCKLNSSSSRRKLAKECLIMYDVDKASIISLGSLGGIQPYNNGGVKLAFGVGRRKGTIVTVSSVEFKVVCTDDELLIQSIGKGNGKFSVEKSLPPWGNIENHEDESEDDMQLEGTEEDDDKLGDGSNLSPWGNIEVSSNHGTEFARNVRTLVVDTEKVTSTFEPGLYFLEERDEEILSVRLLGLSRSNKVRSALDLFMSMEASGLQPSHHAVNSLISCLLRKELLNEAMKVFEISKNSKNTTGHTYSLILKAVASIQGCSLALKMFTELEGVQQNSFDIIVYNTVISICARSSNWREVESIWKMLKDNGCRASTVTYRLLISTFARCEQPELAYNAYNEMIQEGLQPSGDVMQAIISVCTKERKWDLALQSFNNMLNIGLEPNLIAYNALINSLGKVGEVEQAFRIFNLMKHSNHAPDVYTWNALMTALYNAEMYHDAMWLFESIKRDGSCQLNSYLYNTALMSCQRLSSWDRALQLLWQMETNGLSVTTESYNLVISVCETARRPKVALEVYEHMVHMKCNPDAFTYLSLIRACIWGSFWYEVEEILRHITPDASLYNAAIHGMCLQGKITSARKLYMKMRESGLKPDGKTRALMLQNLKRHSDRPRKLYYSSRRRPCR